MGSKDDEVLKSDEEEAGVVEQKGLTPAQPLPRCNRHGRRSLSRPRRKLNSSDLKRIEVRRSGQNAKRGVNILFLVDNVSDNGDRAKY